ncbi:MAG: IS66 family transposase [Gammaproteobacteria bacterium]
MPAIAPVPDLPPPEERPPWLNALLEIIAAQGEELHRLREDNQALRDEVARLKGQKGKPSIGPSRLNPKKRRKRRGRRGRGRGSPGRIDRTEVVKAKDIPDGSRFKGYADFDVQELIIKTETIRYRVERWLTPAGKLLTGELPSATVVGGSHFGATMQSFILYQYYHALVTEPLLLEQLREYGVTISSGQLHALVTEGKERFHREKGEILRMGLRVSSHIHVDDTGARHRGKNGYCTHIGNEWFAWFESTESKSRVNFLQLLRSGHLDYVLNDEALTYMEGQKLPRSMLLRLKAEVETQSADDVVFADKTRWQAALDRFALTDERHVRIATEGALLGSVLMHGVNPELAIVSDDAGQFNVLCHALCWIHAERVLAKLLGFNDEQRAALEDVRTVVWDLYRDLKAYKAAPKNKVRRALEKRFDDLCATQTCFVSLNHALERMGRNKRELLLVLERPELPLHNNLSEGDIREYVKRRKISGGTRNDDGRRGRDTFASLKKTCRKLGVSFWKYLTDRICGADLIPALPNLIEARALSP